MLFTDKRHWRSNSRCRHEGTCAQQYCCWSYGRCCLGKAIPKQYGTNACNAKL